MDQKTHSQGTAAATTMAHRLPNLADGERINCLVSSGAMLEGDGAFILGGSLLRRPEEEETLRASCSADSERWLRGRPGIQRLIYALVMHLDSARDSFFPAARCVTVRSSPA